MLSFNKKSVLRFENMSSEELKRKENKKIFYRNQLLEQIEEKKRQKFEEEKRQRKTDELIEQKMRNKYKQVQKSTEAHIKKHSKENLGSPACKIFEEKNKSTKKNTSSSYKENNKKSLINTSLSKNYVMKHKITDDYNTLTVASESNRHNLKFQKKKKNSFFENSAEKKKIRNLRLKLQELQKKCLRTMQEKEKAEKLLLKKNKILKDLKNKLEENNFFDDDQIENFSGSIACQTDFIPIPKQDFNINNKKSSKNLFYRNSTTKKSIKNESVINNFDDIIQNYYKN